MCGIFGMIGAFNKDMYITISRLAEERGGHGYGIHVASKNQKFTIHSIGKIKEVESLITSIIKDQEHVKIIGHCRLASSDIFNPDNLENLQPIKVGSYDKLVTHNGSVTKYEEYKKTYRIRTKTTLDTEVLAYMILHDLRGSHQVFNEEPISIYFEKYSSSYIYRNKLPLYLLETEGAVTYCSKYFEQSELIPDKRTIKIHTNESS